MRKPQLLRFKSESTPAELKHLSKRWKIEQTFIPSVAASEKGRAQTKSVIYYVLRVERLKRCFAFRQELVALRSALGDLQNKEKLQIHLLAKRAGKPDQSR